MSALGYNRSWGECRVLTVPGGAQVRVEYPFEGRTHSKELVFPEIPKPRIPNAIYLK